MKSINSKDNSNCTPTSSNCIIWQGPCIDCINVNTGDTISDVVFEMATLLCNIQQVFDLTDLQLGCLTLGGQSKTLENVLQIIITKLCSIPTPEPAPEPEEVVVTVASCFQITDNNGDLITTMKVSDYARAIGIKVCSLQSLVNQHTTTLSNHETRIVTLENANHDVVLPLVTPSCVMAAVPTAMVDVLDALEDQFCTLRSVTGTSTALGQGIAKQCASLNSAPALSQSGTMGSISGWKTTVSTVADSLNNLWLTICDMRAAVVAVQSCCAVKCTDIIINFIVTAAENGTVLKIFFSGYSSIPTGFADCGGNSIMNITDGLGGSYNLNINTVLASADPNPITVTIADTPLSNSGTFNLSLASCLTNGTLTCNKTVVKQVSAPQSSCGIPTNIIATIN